ncbi:MAG: outer membrane protein assembly factor BamD [Myxococcales bacterium]|nr:outer membrane protein assembly factor BamD [Myxococcales bacterium]
MQRLRGCRRYLVALLLAPVAAGGCAELSESTKSVSYSNSAKDNYDRGLGELKGENWLDAIKYFTFTRTKFGFSKWATLAELGIADGHFGGEKFQEAIEAYRTFIKGHPTHEMTQNGYAAFRIGEAFYKEIPSEWFLVPPAYEKDQGPVRDALRELSAFVDEYGDSPYAARARKLTGDCVKRLADHELYVATFYLDRNKPLATIARLEGLVREYPGSNREPEVLILLGRTYLKMEKPAEAKQAFERLIASHPKDYNAEKARLYLDYIVRRYGALTPPAAPTAPAPPGGGHG